MFNIFLSVKEHLSVLSETEKYICCRRHGKNTCYSFLIQTIFSGVYRAHLFLFLPCFKETHPQVCLKSFNSWCILITSFLAIFFPSDQCKGMFFRLHTPAPHRHYRVSPCLFFTFFVDWYQCFPIQPHVSEKGSPSGYRPAYADATGICHVSLYPGVNLLAVSSVQRWDIPIFIKQ